MEEVVTLNSKVGIKIGNLDVIGNGIVHVSDSMPLRLNIDGLIMNFNFINEKGNKKAHWETAIEDNILTWNLYNNKNQLGEGVIQPISLGVVDGRDLLASFFIWTPDFERGLRIINYVIYLGENKNEH